MLRQKRPLLAVRAIFVLPWNENAQTNNKRTEIERFDWFMERIQTRVGIGWFYAKLGWEKLVLENFLEINQYFALTSYCDTIGQSNNAFSILGKTKRPCFDLFIHWLIKQISNTSRNHFSIQRRTEIALLMSKQDQNTADTHSFHYIPDDGWRQVLHFWTFRPRQMNLYSSQDTCNIQNPAAE